MSMPDVLVEVVVLFVVTTAVTLCVIAVLAPDPVLRQRATELLRLLLRLRGPGAR